MDWGVIIFIVCFGFFFILYWYLMTVDNSQQLHHYDQKEKENFSATDCDENNSDDSLTN